MVLEANFQILACFENKDALFKLKSWFLFLDSYKYSVWIIIRNPGSFYLGDLGDLVRLNNPFCFYGVFGKIAQNGKNSIHIGLEIAQLTKIIENLHLFIVSQIMHARLALFSKIIKGA